MPKVTLKSLAGQLGVSYAIVSRVLRGDPSGRVSEAKRRQIVALAAELGYRPNHAGRSLRNRRSNILALIVPDVTNPFYAALFRAVEAASLARGYSVILCNTDEDPGRIDKLLDVLGDGHVDGWLVATARQADPYFDLLNRSGTPYVLLNRRSDSAGAPWVGPDDFQTGRLGGMHLLELGHRRITYLTADLGIRAMSTRLDGFMDAVRNWPGGGAKANVVTMPPHRSSSRPAVATALQGPPENRPSAFFVSNSVLLEGTLAAIREAGLRVPQDISVIGYNPFSEATCSGIKVPVDEIGRIGTEWLISGLEQGRVDGTLNTVLPVSFEDHGTTAPARKP